MYNINKTQVWTKFGQNLKSVKLRTWVKGNFALDVDTWKFREPSEEALVVGLRTFRPEGGRLSSDFSLPGI
jgi:hypothetical protein